MNGQSFPPIQFGGIFLQPITWQASRPFTYTFSHMIFLVSYVIVLNKQVDDLRACHVVGWRRISLNRVGGKLFPT